MFNHLVEGEARANSEHRYVEPDAIGELHLSAIGGWRILEWLLKKVKWQEWPKRKRLFGYYLPNCEPRLIPEGAAIHESVLRRREAVSDYRPVNLPTRYDVVR